MNLRAWATAFRDAFRSMTQSSLMSVASIATVAVSLLVLSVVMLVAVNLENMASSVEGQVEIKAYLCSARDADPPCNKQELNEDLKRALVEQVKQFPGVKEVEYIPRDKALEQMKEQFGDQRDILEELGENPLRDSLEVKAADPNQVKSLAETIGKMNGVAEVNYGQEYVDKLLLVTRAVRYGGIGLVLMLIVATVLTISNTIRLAVYARRREISIMKLVGATDWYIRRPFMLEGIFLGVIGSGLAMTITGWGYRRLALYVYQSIPFLPVVAPERILLNLTLSMIILGGVLGAVGSLISMRRFLKV
jgi:cell division transport system permease protein